MEGIKVENEESEMWKGKSTRIFELLEMKKKKREEEK